MNRKCDTLNKMLEKYKSLVSNLSRDVKELAQASSGSSRAASSEGIGFALAPLYRGMVGGPSQSRLGLASRLSRGGATCVPILPYAKEGILTPPWKSWIYRWRSNPSRYAIPIKKRARSGMGAICEERQLLQELDERLECRTSQMSRFIRLPPP